MKFPKTASPDISGVEGPHHVAKNIGNNFYSKIQQQLQKLKKNEKKKILFLKLLLDFQIEIVADIFGNMMGTHYTQNVRRRDFRKFHKIFAEIQHLKSGPKLAFLTLLS